MALRWAASAFLEVEKRFRRIMGYRDLWMLESVLNEKGGETTGKAVDAKGTAA